MSSDFITSLMNNPDIYTIKLMGYPEAQYVLWQDYERLKAEVDALMTNPTSRLLRASRAENARLTDCKAEADRLLGILDTQLCAAQAECRKRGYLASDLEDEVERLKSENLLVREESDRHYGLWIEEKDKTERLRKAGDCLIDVLGEMDVIMDMDSDHPEVAAWQAAKDGNHTK